MSLIEKIDVKSAIEEMLEEGLLIKPKSVCVYMGLSLEPYEVGRDKDGFPIYRDNVKVIYAYMDKLRDEWIDWLDEIRTTDYSRGWKKAEYRDEKGIAHRYSDEMDYKGFLLMRIPERGLLLIPKNGVWIIPNKKERDKWIQNNVERSVKSLKTSITKGVSTDSIEDTRKVRKFLGFETQDILEYKKEDDKK